MRDVGGASLTEVSMLVLASLANADRHGYGIQAEVRTLSEGRVRLGTGTLYGALERLLDAGHVRIAREEVVDGRLRRYYHLTSSGRGALVEDLTRREQQLHAARVRLSGAM